jgi:hypothetical protein
MHARIVIVMGILSALYFCRDHDFSGGVPTKGDSKYDAVMALPDGIEVTHTPDKVYAEEGGGRSGRRYTWLHKTSVRSKVGDLSIVEFGAFLLDRGKWSFGTATGEPFTPADFAEWYSCPNAELVDGATFTDPLNWAGAEVLRESSGLWYFIAENSKGERFKGVSQVYSLGKTKSEQGGAGQSATGSQSKFEGGDKHQPQSGGRSR